MKNYYTEIPTPLGLTRIVCHVNGITALHWKGSKQYQEVKKFAEHDPAHQYFKKAEIQLKQYFEGRRKIFDLPLCPEGTQFQKKSWRYLRKIPYGKTRSYGEQARAIGSPRGFRAVGQANGKNPLPIFIPCHRVIGASGKLTGFSAGLDRKEKLLKIENIL